MKTLKVLVILASLMLMSCSDNRPIQDDGREEGKVTKVMSEDDAAKFVKNNLGKNESDVMAQLWEPTYRGDLLKMNTVEYKFDCPINEVPKRFQEI